MEQFVIYLPDYENSTSWATRTIETGTANGWNIQLFEGINGTKVSLADYELHASKINKKCFRYMQRSGTIGCFLSHYLLWKRSIKSNTPISIFEHDVVFLKEPPSEYNITDITKYEGFNLAKPIPCGNWWEGARAYTVTPQGAKKLVNWVSKHGAMPADWMLCDGIVDVSFDLDNRVTFKENQFSFTKDL